jgi:hypothetical protein
VILAVDFQGGIENAWSNVATFVPKLFAALDQLQVAPRIVTGLWYAILAAVVGSVIVAVGGGGIRTMQCYWDRMAGKAEERGPRATPAGPGLGRPGSVRPALRRRSDRRVPVHPRGQRDRPVRHRQRAGLPYPPGPLARSRWGGVAPPRRAAPPPPSHS